MGIGGGERGRYYRRVNRRERAHCSTRSPRFLPSESHMVRLLVAAG